MISNSSLQLEERTSTPVFRQLIVRMVMLVVVKTIAEIMDNLSSFVSDEWFNDEKTFLFDHI